MADKKNHVLCVTCQTKLPPATEIKYFAQAPLFPTEDDFGFGEELDMMLSDMEALFNAIAWGENEQWETDKQLAKLGVEVAAEARRRFNLLTEAQNILYKRYDTLRKRLGEEEAA